MTAVHTVPAALAGPTVREGLTPTQREQFDQEFRAALATAGRSFDLEEAAEVVRRWWTVVGGDPAVAEADRQQAARMAHLTERDWGEPRPIYVPAALINQTGPAVRAALTEDDRAKFETDLEHALADAAESFDHRPAAAVVTRWWAFAVTLANPDDFAQDLATARELAAGEDQQ